LMLLVKSRLLVLLEAHVRVIDLAFFVGVIHEAKEVFELGELGLMPQNKIIDVYYRLCECF